MKGSLKGFGSLYKAPNKTKYYNTELGFSFSDFLDDPKATLAAEATRIEDKVSDYSKDVLGDDLYAKASTMIKVEGDRLVSSAQDLVIAEASGLINTKENQDSAITGGVNAMASKVSASLIDVKDTYAAHGITGLFNKFPIPFYIGGGVSALLLARFVLGGKKKVYVKGNPKKKRKTKK